MRNPFARNGIKSLSIPLFINQSIIPGMAGPLTRELFLLLSHFPDLQVYQGEDKSADGVLLGIISSEDLRHKTFIPSQHQFTESSEIVQSIGNRNPFFIPTRVDYQLSLRLVLIKRPSEMDMAFLKTKLSTRTPRHPAVVFDRTLNLSGGYVQTIDDNTGPDRGGPVNFTKNQGNFRKSVEDLAKSAAENFKQEILDVF
ncbi:MAG: hypothetical protein OXB84_08855 [Halobacteriovoraceae bacterium]|nr:hypothetical protein [Halobacteriovoraceae bacterium]